MTPSLNPVPSCLLGAQVITSARRAALKRAYTTRRVPDGLLARLDTDPAAVPRAGDLVLARVQRVGKHASLESTGGRRCALFVGDEVLVAYGARYAPDQFEAYVPESLAPCHLAAGGGVAARVVARHGGVAEPTEIVPIGLVLDAQGRRVNLERAALPRAEAGSARPLTLASLGTSMNAGKTTAAAHLIRGLVRGGLIVGGAKITGTGSGNDPGLLLDAGAAWVLDFTDCGHASTFGLELPALRDILFTIQARMSELGVDVLVLEVADGLLQRETAMLLRSPEFAQRVDGCLFSSGEAMGAIAGAAWLRGEGLPLLALAGTMTRSPLARAEAARATGLPVLGLAELGAAREATELVERARLHRRQPAAA